MKKLILLFIVLFTITSYSITITVINREGKPLTEVIAKINNQVKIGSSEGIVSFDTKDKILNISLSKEGYKEEVLILKNSINEVTNLTLIMNPLKTTNVTFKFSLPEGVIQYREVGARLYTSLPFLGGSKSFNLPIGTYEFIFLAKNSKTSYKILNFKDDYEHYFIDLDIQKNNFFIIGNASSNKSIKFYKENIGKIIPTKDVSLIIFKNSKIIKKIQLKDTFIPLELENGIYDFMVMNRSYTKLFFRGIEINNKTNKNIVITIPPIQSTVHGVIKNNNQFLGGAKVLFTDVNNNSYETTSNFVGDFSINIPSNKYKITLKKTGFILKKNQNLIYNFTTPKESYNLTLDTEELLSNIEGIVVDNRGTPLPNAKILVKNGTEIVNLKSDDFGNFSTPILPGLLFIKVEKNGYKAFGLVTKLERFSSISGLKVTLTPFLSNISGIIGSSFSPLKNIHLTLRNQEGEVIANTISNQNGYYEFSDIKIDKTYFISVGAQSYKYYFSETFTLVKEDLINKNILLQSRNIRVYLEFLSTLKTPLSDHEILIDGINYKTDTNGFLLLELPEGKKTINLEIKSYSYKKQIDLKSMSKNPNHLTFIIK